jgi:hypothetical protein
MIEIKLQDNTLQLITARLAHIPRALPKVVSRAINKTSSSARAQAVKLIKKDSGLKAKDIRSRIFRKPATYSKWLSTLYFSSNPIPIMKLSPKKVASGVSYKEGSGRKTIKSAFIATMPTEHTGVFLRDSKQRLPISEQYKPSLASLVSGDILNKVVSRAALMLESQIFTQMGVLLDKVVGK